ncbi:MAG TPA: putative Ig domain-containing protein [Candidatus Dormibacteraeota bacterium]|nr:putative Ig domain-containing protein [Candidatus Dormibacteraeota bacterium]
MPTPAFRAFLACGLTLLLGSVPIPAARAADNVQPTSQALCSTPSLPHQVQCFAMRLLMATPDAPAGYGPADLRSAYRLPTGSGGGATVAVVDAYDDPSAEADLAVYRQRFALPPCTTANGCFRKVNEYGQAAPLPAPDVGWAGEISLDLDMVSAICPACHLLLLEAASNQDADLFTAVSTAVTMGARYISNSYGEPEFAGEVTTDAQTFDHPGVVITASAGDSGYGTAYPAVSRYVTAVGGTTLMRAANPRGWVEAAWPGTGSGCSSFVARPSWQDVVTDCAQRAVVDVSAVADPSTGVAVYDTYGGLGGWNVFGGTSVGAPLIAAVYALAGTPGAGDEPASYPYAHPSDLNDVTDGSNGGCGNLLCTAGSGWDGPTGLGTPSGVAAFAPTSSPPAPVSVAPPGTQSTSLGQAVDLRLHASGGVPPYRWSAMGLPPGLSIDPASGQIAGAPTRVGTFRVTVTARDQAGATGSTTFDWVVVPACAPRQLLGNPGFEDGTAPWTATPGVIASNADGETAHSGTHYAWLDGYGVPHVDTLSQQVTIPSGCVSSVLSFWLKVVSDDHTGVAHDTLTVRVGSQTVATYSNLDASGTYVRRTVDLSRFAGQTVTIQFVGSEDASLATSFLIDDTALEVR